MVGYESGREPMDNASLARVFEDISRLLEVKADSPFKINAYRTGARAMAAYPEQLRDMMARGEDIRRIPGIGEAIANKTVELLTTGHLVFFDRLVESSPPGVLELMRLSGIGPRTAARLSQELGVSSLDQLETALRSGAVSQLPGFGDKTVHRLLAEIESHRRQGSDPLREERQSV